MIVKAWSVVFARSGAISMSVSSTMTTCRLSPPSPPPDPQHMNGMCRHTFGIGFCMQSFTESQRSSGQTWRSTPTSWTALGGAAPLHIQSAGQEDLFLLLRGLYVGEARLVVADPGCALSAFSNCSNFSYKWSADVRWSWWWWWCANVDGGPLSTAMLRHAPN